VLETFTQKEFIVSTTGKLSRELFEYRAANKQPHNSDFLIVGSMGYASMIALGVAKQKPSQKVVCFDGDGALLMHAGNMSSIGFSGVQNYTHIVFNNGAHESVGGQDTLALKVDLPLMATANGYSFVQSVSTMKDLKEAMTKLNQHKGVSFLEIKVKMESRNDLGRPTLTPIENKLGFMNKISSDE
jgi:phosphonopyruvate decarboxylase